MPKTDHIARMQNKLTRIGVSMKLNGGQYDLFSVATGKKLSLVYRLDTVARCLATSPGDLAKFEDLMIEHLKHELVS